MPSASIVLVNRRDEINRLSQFVEQFGTRHHLVTDEALDVNLVLDEIVITRNSSDRATDIDDLAAIAVEVFGSDRVAVADTLLEALDTAFELAERSDDEYLSGSGILVTGSVITAGDARTLLGAK